MHCIINGRLLLEDRILDGATLLYDDKIIDIADKAPAGVEIIDAAGGYVAPGLIDLHCHGFLGMDASNGDLGEWVRMSELKAAQGVTAWLPTTMTLPWAKLEHCFETARQAIHETAKAGFRGARVLGVNAEGPFISPARKGAQDGGSIQRPDIEKVRPWADVIKLMTVAPEVDGALRFISAARKLGIRVSMGHTDATYAQAMDGIAAGIGHATHLFNAMSPLSHRAPGVVGAALGNAGVTCELIADDFHVHPALYPLLEKLAGNRLALITDSIAVAGLPDGPHDQLGVTVVVDGDRLRFPDGTIAGSALTLDRAVRNFHRHTGLPLWQVVNMATLHPARALGIEGRKGRLAPGLDADLVIADLDFNIRRAITGGETVWNAEHD